ncbi:MAG TPA: methylmalonyl Co-A mutase-associated GTPase MeaB [Candidatus Krumholzibacteria bacterium]|nr:methylmalonyl Co-A mutase-associated GTPase MeaB [Candidatus Krumholzibacteria bacterium]HPD70175.1 methylmalonyl Co-A mutase-associated GTPase MeaB [Candidatus Krumholzibacteria bacterium]HRY40125.1 methylmalonyl Co-A mutase-associated GTPase MeaB [Candidatus Krumholzibacteria bacterium]
MNDDNDPAWPVELINLNCPNCRCLTSGEREIGLDTALDTLLGTFLSGDRRAAARLISVVENGGPRAEAVLHALYPRLGGAPRVGVTGPPGVGKSTLVDALVRHHRGQGRRVGVVAVDPTSPFTGGAVLGDRVRMSDLATDLGVFIRSMATRGSLGGLARTTKEVVDVLEAFGQEILLIETVGVGQTEMDIASAADTVVVVVSPESGDAIQAMKAGLMEVADLLVVNKADRPGTSQMVRALEADLAMRPAGGWRPPVLVTVASRGEGTDEVAAAVGRHREHLSASGALGERRHARARAEIVAILRDRLWQRVHERLADRLPDWVARVEAGHATPYTAARALLAAFLEDEA